jgi:hypothetical protein
MTDPPQYPEGDDTDEEPKRKPGAPAWVSVALIVLAVVAAIAIVVLHLTGVVGPGAH